jgi:Flp pilus assembly protein TadD
MGALAALSAVLLGCASAPPVNDATALSGTRQKGKDDASVTARPAGAPTNIDGAVKQAQAQRKSEDLSAAAHTLSQLVLLAPDDARVLGESGKTLIAMGRTDDALAFLERAVELQPKDWSLFSAQGVAYDQKGEYLAAQAAYGRALLLKPGDPTVLSNAALSHVQTGDLDGAEALLMQASPSSAEFPRIASNLALVRNLKNSRPPQAPSVVPAKEGTLVPSPTPVEAPSAPDTPVARLPTPESNASDIPMVPQRASVTETTDDGVGAPAAMAKSKPTGIQSGVRSGALKNEPVP